MDFVNQHTHEGGLETEVQAAIRASYRADSIKSQILNELASCGDNGLTPDEFNKATNGLINTTRRRFTDLWKEGHIKHHPNNLTRVNDKGNECTVWVLGRDTNTKTRFELLNDEITRLKEILISHKIDPYTGKRDGGENDTSNTISEQKSGEHVSPESNRLASYFSGY